MSALRHFVSVNECSPADLSNDDSVTLADITFQSDGIGLRVREALADRVQSILAEHGERAFDCTKTAAAIHEAGHVVVHVALGGGVRRVRIEQQSGHWIGYTEYREGEWKLSPQNETPEKFLAISRDLYAGIAAEDLFDSDHRAGSSLDEVIMSQILSERAAYIVGADPEQFWNEQVIHTVTELLLKNHDAHAAITERLMKCGSVRGGALALLCARVHA